LAFSFVDLIWHCGVHFESERFCGGLLVEDLRSLNRLPSYYKEVFMKKGILDKAVSRKSAWRVSFEAFLNVYAFRMIVVYVLLVIVDILVRYRMSVALH
jgi:hypothetical protein